MVVIAISYSFSPFSCSSSSSSVIIIITHHYLLRFLFFISLQLILLLLILLFMLDSLIPTYFPSCMLFFLIALFFLHLFLVFLFLLPFFSCSKVDQIAFLKRSFALIFDTVRFMPIFIHNRPGYSPKPHYLLVSSRV